VGRHLLPLLLETGYDVFHLLRETCGHQGEAIWDFRGPLPNDLPVCDVVIHLAACVDFSQEMNVVQYEVNSASTAKLARYCQKTDAAMILASMAGIHGTEKNISSDVPISPVTHYGMSKYLAEQIVQIFVKDAVILRIAGIYGLDGPKHLGLNAAITDAVYFNRPPVLRGSGQGKRNYVCVKDVAKWIFGVVKRRDAEGRLIDSGRVEVMYLSGPECMTIEQYLQTIVDVLLPGEEIVKEDGVPGEDCVVRGTPSLFPLRSFSDYLKELPQTRIQDKK